MHEKMTDSRSAEPGRKKRWLARPADRLFVMHGPRGSHAGSAGRRPGLAALLCSSLLLSVCQLIAPLALAGPLGAQGEDFLYEVEAGDTLGDLAVLYTGAWSGWSRLQEINQVADPYALPIGKVLRIPLSMIPRQAASAGISHVSGTVLADGRPLRPGDSVHAGQQLLSVQGGSATMVLEDQSLLTLEPGASVHVEHMQTFTGSGLTDTILRIPAGSLESSVAPANTGVGRFEVRTPATVTGVRGTRLRVHTDPAGSRHEVLQGRAAVQGEGAENLVRPGQGAAHDVSGKLLGLRDLLPAPLLSEPVRSGSGWLLEFAAVPQAVAYRIQVARDAAGSQRETSRLVTEPRAQVYARGAGARHVFVRAIDSLGIEGQESVLELSFMSGLTSSDGKPVTASDGTPIALQHY